MLHATPSTATVSLPHVDQSGLLAGGFRCVREPDRCSWDRADYNDAFSDRLIRFGDWPFVLQQERLRAIDFDMQIDAVQLRAGDPAAISADLFRRALTQAAGALGVDPRMWRNWERGQTVLYRQHRPLVARFLDLSTAVVNQEMEAPFGFGCTHACYRHRFGVIPTGYPFESNVRVSGKPGVLHNRILHQIGRKANDNVIMT